MADTHCLECHHWDGLDATVGICRRHAPNPDTSPGHPTEMQVFYATWPLTQADDWCGEFSPKAAPP